MPDLGRDEGRIRLLLEAHADYRIVWGEPSTRADMVMIGAASEILSTEERIRQLARKLHLTLTDAIDSLGTDDGVASISELQSQPVEFDLLLQLRAEQIRGLERLGRLVNAIRYPQGEGPPF